MADAEAIAEAASRPTMRFVAVKSEAQQAAVMAYRTRDLLVHQRTQTINALRSHLAEQGIVAPTGPAHVGRLAAIIDGDDGMLPAAVRDLSHLLLDQIVGLTGKIAGPRQHGTAADDDPGGGRGDRSGDHHLRAADGELLHGSGLRRLGRPHTAPTFERRQGPARPNLEDGPARHSPIVDHRRGRGGTGQPDGAHGLGTSAEERGLQGSGDDGRVAGVNGLSPDVRGGEGT